MSQHAHPSGRRFLSKRAVAARYDSHPGTIDRWVRNHQFPPPVQVSGPTGACLWPLDELEKWEAEQLAKARGAA